MEYLTGLQDLVVEVQLVLQVQPTLVEVEAVLLPLVIFLVIHILVVLVVKVVEDMVLL